MEVGNTRHDAAAVGCHDKREASFLLRCRVEDAFELDPLAILSTRGHAVEGDWPRNGQRRLAQNAHSGLCDLGGKVASGSDALRLYKLTRS